MAQKKQEKLIFDTLAEDKKDFFVQSLEKKVRSINKKLKEIKQLESDQKEGKDLKEAQLSKVASKEDLLSKRKEYDSFARLYLEAKTEYANEKKETVKTETTTPTTDSVTETVKQFVNLFYATYYSYQTNTNTTLSQYYVDVFNSGKRTRVEDATTELISYLTGEKATLKEEVSSVVASEGFLTHETQFDTFKNTSTSPVQEEKQETVEEVQQQEDVTKEVTDFVQHPQTEVQVPQETYNEQEKHVEHVPEEKQSPVKMTEQQEQQEQHQVETTDQQVETTAQQVETTGEQVQTTVEQGETGKEQQGEKKFFKKPYQRRNSGGYKKPREQRQGENQQTEGYDKRAPRPYNGPRQGGNRSNKRTTEGENKDNNGFNNQENENTNFVKTAVDDGWNVVHKGPKTQDGGYKPRREVGNQNYNNQKRTGDHVNKRPNHSGNKRPFNKTGEQPQYVRKDNTTTVNIF